MQNRLLANGMVRSVAWALLVLIMHRNCSKAADLPGDKPEPKVWWSLASIERPPVRHVANQAWVRTPIDAFILAALEAKGLKPAAEADRPTLIRRLSFDLLGLPPTPEEIQAFVNDASPSAYDRLVERLLASPRYGERWARHWLDVAHYGDTHGYDKDKRRDHAWPYRDYVIRSFNADKRYDRFIQEQLAGDYLFPNEPDAVVATGFIAAGPWDFVGQVELREGTVDKEKTRLLDRDDMVASTMGTFASLTVHCARCHNHKFDPIPRRDYYRLQAVFAGVDRGDRPIKAGTKQPLVYAVVSHAPRPIYDLKRGDVEQHGELVSAGPLSCLPSLETAFAPGQAPSEGAQRAQLAHWLIDQRNPLTWRSIVNRVWLYHFGRGLVDTPNDFGRNGSLPTNRTLLDWLADEFLARGQSIKELHRLIVSSAVYRQQSINPKANADVDADNRLLWRMERRRLDAEEVRDAVLRVSGSLREFGGGPAYEPFRFKDDHSPIYDHADVQKMLAPATFRRTIYAFSVRSVPNPFLECLDGADANLTTPVRSTTVTPLQALALLNDPFMVDQATRFAIKLRQSCGDAGGQVRRAFVEILGRDPTTAEQALLAEYAAHRGLANLCRFLMNTNEFLFVD
ncbi:MAG TPA: DUF1549 and DUF1553 domain-containing protein [Gemmataceae bacterium]|jgi:hypothetical protein|nr:DUF1549 and DUF1553 domain-containing protein [Gemmataceae bacterium]